MVRGTGDLGGAGDGTIGPAVAVCDRRRTDATAIAAGDHQTCAVLTARTVKCWGWNGFGELGNGTTTDSFTPVAVSGITNATAIATGFSHTCAVLAGGAAKCWGHNPDGELGNGTTTDSSTPIAVTGIATATAISANDQHTCAVPQPGRPSAGDTTVSGSSATIPPSAQTGSLS